MEYWRFCTKNCCGTAKNLVFGRMGIFLARFLAVFGEGKSGGKKIGEREGFQLIEVIWEVPKTGRECQKFSFWQNGDIFGRIFGRCLMIEMAEMPRNKGIQGLYGECQKLNFWQNRGMFLAY